MNVYFWFSTLSFGLIFVLHFLNTFFISTTQNLEGQAHGASVNGMPMWMIYLFLLTFGIFFLIFGFKKRLSRQQNTH